MTEEQMKRFIGAAQTGWALGLTHPYEWLVNADRMLGYSFNYYEKEGMEGLIKSQYELYDAFVAFFKGTAGCPEEAEELKELTIEKLIKNINRFYKGPKDE